MLRKELGFNVVTPSIDSHEFIIRTDSNRNVASFSPNTLDGVSIKLGSDIGYNLYPINLTDTVCLPFINYYLDIPDLQKAFAPSYWNGSNVTPTHIHYFFSDQLLQPNTEYRVVFTKEKPLYYTESPDPMDGRIKFEISGDSMIMTMYQRTPEIDKPVIEYTLTDTTSTTRTITYTVGFGEYYKEYNSVQSMPVTTMFLITVFEFSEHQDYFYGSSFIFPLLSTNSTVTTNIPVAPFNEPISQEDFYNLLTDLDNYVVESDKYDAVFTFTCNLNEIDYALLGENITHFTNLMQKYGNDFPRHYV